MGSSLLPSHVNTETRRLLQRHRDDFTSLAELGMPQHDLVPANGARQIADRGLADSLTVDPDLRPRLRVDIEQPIGRVNSDDGGFSSFDLDGPLGGKGDVL